MKPKLLLLEPIHDNARKILERFVDIKEDSIDVMLSHDYPGEKVIGVYTQLNIVLDNIFPYVDKFVACPCTGINHLANVPDRLDIIYLDDPIWLYENIHATAEHTMALILSLIRRIPWATRDTDFNSWSRDAYKGIELHGKTLGIIGYGRVGKQVAEIASAFGMNVIWYDPFVEPELIDNDIRQRESLEDLLKESDIISVHVSLNESTKGLIGKKEFELMKYNAYFINTSRGDVIDEEALIEVLENHHLNGIALDVLKNEPNINKAIIDTAQNSDTDLIITPHIGGYTYQSREKTDIHIAKRIVDYISKLPKT